MITVSVLIPSDDADQYLLKFVEGRGWWLIHGRVGANCTAKAIAQRIATEVELAINCIRFSLSVLTAIFQVNLG